MLSVSKKQPIVIGELQRKRVLLAKRLFFAESSMHQALCLAEFALENKLGREPDIFTPIMGGICVVYARPFLRADGLGPLDGKYESFKDASLKETHDDLIRNRHSFYAHRDLIKTRAIDPQSNTVHDMHTVILNFDGNDSYTFATREPTYRDITLPNIITLAKHQRERIGSDRHKVIDNLCKGTCPPKGLYELGVNFPIKKR